MSMSRASPKLRPSLSLILLGAFLLLLWLAGGASRSDAAGQMVIRTAASAILIALCLIGRRTAGIPAKPIWLLLTAALILALVQLIPLPPGIWHALPGRAIFDSAVSDHSQPWRPWSVNPTATINAACSLIIPFTILILVTDLTEDEMSWLPAFLLGLVSMSMLLGLLQFSGTSFNNPLINDSTGAVSGNFANRNHYAVFLAMGCLLAPVWAFLDGRQPQWRGPLALGLTILFILTALASGSRAGVLACGLALGLGLAIVWSGIRRALRRYPSWMPVMLLVGVAALIGFFVFLSVVAGRAVSVDRAFALDQGQDMRTRGMPTVLTMIREYFPFGSGMGSFDAVFRLHEPCELLKPTYFNHAHNDLLEVVLDAGLIGALLLVAALGWWVLKSERAWRAGANARYAVPKLGSSMLLLVIFASAFDYPARTPVMMALMVIAAVWLCQRPASSDGSALPARDQHL